MVKILMHGCNGKMGRMITEIVKNEEDAVIAAGVDKFTGIPNDYPVFEEITQCDVDVDVVIDFSNAGAVCEEESSGCSLYNRAFRRTVKEGR